MAAETHSRRDDKVANLTIDFWQDGNSSAYTTSGWSGPEHIGCWTEGPAAHAELAGLRPGRPYHVTLHAGPYLAPPHVTAQRLGVRVNGYPCFNGTLEGPRKLEFDIPAGAIPPDGKASIELDCPDCVSPLGLGLSGDTRRLGFSVWSMALEPLAEPQSETAPISGPAMEGGTFRFRAAGVCPLCEANTAFVAERDDALAPEWHMIWFRDRLRCVNCASIPRERTLFWVVQKLFPNWRQLRMHESSPNHRGASLRFMRECQGYVASQYDPVLGFGRQHPSKDYRSEDLEAQTFADESFDLVITQDVFEHLLAPDKAIREIARTLAPGGAHIMTVPIVVESGPSRRRARRVGKKVELLAEAQYHGNPMSGEGSLVTVDWGYDIVEYLAAQSGLAVSMFYIDDVTRGMRGACNEVLVCRKKGAVPKL